MVSYTFESKLDVDKVLSSEPWSFDKHLMVVQRYEKDIVLSEMDFKSATFWVQIHNILTKFKNKVAEQISRAIRTVSRPPGSNDGDEIGFIRVLVPQFPPPPPKYILVNTNSQIHI